MEIEVNIDEFEENRIIKFSNEYNKIVNGYWIKEAGIHKDDFFISINIPVFLDLHQEDMESIKNWINNSLELAAQQKRNQILLDKAEKSRKMDEYINSPEYKKRAEEEKEKMEHGYVYILGSDTGKYKIGRTNNLEQRLHQFSISLPISTWVAYSFKTKIMTKAENFLHSFYIKKHQVGEWFALDDKDIEEIKSIEDYSLDGILKDYQTRSIRAMKNGERNGN